jgi:peroxiredoxin
MLVVRRAFCLLFMGIAVGTLFLSTPAVRGWAQQTSASPAPLLHQPGTRMPPFELQLIEGKRISLADFTGRPVYLVFFAPWCDYCNADAPSIGRLYQKYASTSLAILGVDEDADQAKGEGFARKYGWGFPIALEDWKRGPQYRAEILPTHIFIDRNGRLSYFQSGEMKADDVERELQKIL